MQVLVSDTSVLVDLERGSLLEASFRLPHRFAVPDLLYERELKDWGGEELIRLGLSVEELDGNEVERAITYQRREPALSLADCFALTLAKTRSWVLLSGDRALRQLAVDEAVECHGVLWTSRPDVQRIRGEHPAIARRLDRHFETSAMPSSRGGESAAGWSHYVDRLS